MDMAYSTGIIDWRVAWLAESYQKANKTENSAKAKILETIGSFKDSGGDKGS